MDESTIIARIKELNRDDLTGAIERGVLLKILDLKWDEYETKNVGVTRRTAERLIQLVDHPPNAQSRLEQAITMDGLLRNAVVACQAL